MENDVWQVGPGAEPAAWRAPSFKVGRRAAGVPGDKARRLFPPGAMLALIRDHSAGDFEL